MLGIINGDIYIVDRLVPDTGGLTVYTRLGVTFFLPLRPADAEWAILNIGRVCRLKVNGAIVQP